RLLHTAFPSQPINAMRHASILVIISLPDPTFGGGTVFRLFVDAARVPVAVIVVNKIRINVPPELVELFVVVKRIVTISFRHHQQRIQPFRLCPPVLCVAYDADGVGVAEVVAFVVESTYLLIPPVVQRMIYHPLCDRMRLLVVLDTENV